MELILQTLVLAVRWPENGYGYGSATMAMIRHTVCRGSLPR